MIVLEKKTKKKADEVLQKAKLFFGPGGEGLKISSESEGGCYITFDGSGGYVTVTISEESGHTQVKVESREWDYQAKQFLGTL